MPFLRLGRLSAVAPTPPASASGDLPIGAGGYITGLDIAPDGSRACRTDTYGGYVRAPADTRWRQVITFDAMPSGSIGLDANGDLIGNEGVMDIVHAPSSPTTLYFFYRGLLFKTTDRCVTVTQTALSSSTLDPNGSYKNMHHRIAVDPGNPSHVIACPSNAVPQQSSNGGASFTALSGVLAPTTAAGSLVAWAPNDAQTVAVGVTGRGIYESKDGGSTWTLRTSGPTTPISMAYGPTGLLWVIDQTNGSTSNIWRWNGTSWLNPNLGGGNMNRGVTVAPHSTTAGTVYVGIDAGDLIISTNATATTPTWGGINFFSAVRSAPNIPWLAATNEDFFTDGAMQHNPLTGTLDIAQGIGYWQTSNPNTTGDVNWTEDSVGIEQLVVTRIIVPPGGVPIVGVWDRTVFKCGSLTSYPANHGIAYDVGIRHGWSVDYAKSDPTCIVVLGTLQNNGLGSDPEIGISTDGGSTWSFGSGTPTSSYAGGSIAAATPSNFVWIEAGTNARARYSNDGGATWGFITASGLPTSGDTGFGADSNSARQMLTCDADGYFYFYNYGTSVDTSFAGVWKSNNANNGSAFTRVFSGRLDVTGDSGLNYLIAGFRTQLEAVPGMAGRLCYTSGDVGNGSGGGADNLGYFLRSTNAGVSWAAVPNVIEVKAFGFGKAVSGGGGHPAVFIVGFVDYGSGYEFGVHQCNNFEQATPTWTKREDWPAGRVDQVTTVCGDPNVENRYYVGFRGSGAVYSD